MLHLNLVRIKAKFASLLVDVQIALETKMVIIAHVRQFLIHHFQGDLDIPHCADYSEIFTDLTKRKVWTYQHHSPLEMMAKKFLHDNSHIQDEIKQYKGDLSGFFIATKLIDYIEINSLTSEDMEEENEDLQFTAKQYTTLKVVLNLGRRKISKLSLDYVHNLWRKLAEEFDLPSLTAVIKTIVDCSLVITWFVLPHLVEMIVLKSKSPKSVKFFRTHQIVLLQVDDLTIYDEQKMVCT